MGKTDENGAEDNSCNMTKVLMFVSALVAGTICSLSSKMLLSMKSTGLTGEIEDFSYPLFQTTGMFFGMTGGLFFHFIVLYFKIPFPGYVHSKSAGKNGYSAINDEESIGIMSTATDSPAMKPLPMWMYFYLIFPSIFDLVATILAMYGLRYVTVSVYQMLRGSAIVFVAILKQFVLKDILKRYQWVGIALNCLSIVLVGFTAMMMEAASVTPDTDAAEGELPVKAAGGTAFLGVVLILMGALVQSLQYVFEEKVMSAHEDDPNVAPTPPLLLIGMEGLWGLLICVFILYPLAYYTPGSDHGSFENPYNTYAMIANSTDVQCMFILYYFAILFYNILACLVTYMLDSVWHAILDNFRPATVWGVDMLIYYAYTHAFGEPWNEPWSFMQLLGMLVLLYGTAIYNAPNAGSIKLTGGAASCFIDCSDEYEVKVPIVEVPNAGASPEQGRRIGEVVVSANPNPYYVTRSPFLGGNNRVLISPAMRGGAGVSGTPVGVYKHDHVVVIGTPGRAPLSGNSASLLNSQMMTRGMSFGYATSGANANQGVSMGYTHYGAPPPR